MGVVFSIFIHSLAIQPCSPSGQAGWGSEMCRTTSPPGEGGHRRAALVDEGAAGAYRRVLDQFFFFALRKRQEPPCSWPFFEPGRDQERPRRDPERVQGGSRNPLLDLVCTVLSSFRPEVRELARCVAVCRGFQLHFFRPGVRFGRFRRHFPVSDFLPVMSRARTVTRVFCAIACSKAPAAAGYWHMFTNVYSVEQVLCQLCDRAKNLPFFAKSEAPHAARFGSLLPLAAGADCQNGRKSFFGRLR